MDDAAPRLHVPRSMAQNIGDFFIAWGILESEIDRGFSILFCTDPTLAACIYANLSTKAKLDIIASATTMLTPALGKELADEIHECIELAREHLINVRNQLAHSQPYIFGEGENVRWELTKAVARKKLKLKIFPPESDHWRIEASLIYIISDGFHASWIKVQPVMGALSRADLDRICEFDSQEIPSKSLPRRKPRPPKPSGSRRSSRGKA